MADTQIVKVLLVEDSPTDARLLRHNLSELAGQKYEPVWVDRISDAIAQLQKQSFDVGLLDLTLPDSNGIATYTRIQEAAPGLPMVVLTGAVDEAAGAEAIRHGVQEYLVKGAVDGKAVARAIRYAIERKRAEEGLRRLNTELEQRVAEIQAANKELQSSRRAALNLVEDALEARKQTELAVAELRQSEGMLKRAQEISHLGSWELDLTQNRLTWSDEVYRIFGLKPQEFKATYEAFLDAVHADDRMAVDAAYTGSLREGKDSYEIEHRIIRKSTGEVRIVHERGEHFRDESGKIIRSVGMVHDITERKQAETALQQSKSRFELLTHTAEELLQASEPQKSIESLCNNVMKHLDCQAFFNFLADEKAGKLHLNACAGIPREEANKIEWLDYGVAVCGCSARDGKRIVAEHIPTTADVRTELVKSYGIKAYACHPILAEGGTVIGTLSFGTKIRETFSAEDLSLMKAVTDQVAVAIVRIQNEQALALARDEWEETFNVMPDLVAIMDTDHRIIRANKAMMEKVGNDPSTAGLLCYQCVHGAKAPINGCPHVLALKDGKEHVVEIHEERLGGDFLVSVTPIFGANSGIKGCVHVARNITVAKKREDDLKRLNRTLRALGNSSQLMMRAMDEAGYLQQVCDIVIKDCGHKMVWIGFAQEDEAKSVLPVACSGFEQGYLETLNISWGDNERGQGPTGTAIRTGKAATCKSILTDPRFAPWREEALKRGYASSIVLPLMAEDKAFGAMSIYSTEPEAFSQDETVLLAELANDLAYGITSIRLRVAREQAEETVRAERNFSNAVIQTTGGLIVGLDPEGRIQIFNKACEKTTGYSFDEVKNRQLWDFLLIPEEMEPVKETFTKIREGTFNTEIEFENYWVAKDGTRRFIKWANSSLKDEQGAVTLILGTGIDITERRAMEQQLRQQAIDLAAKNSELDAFSRSVSHELRNPLHTILLCSEFLTNNSDPASDSKISEAVHHIDNSSRHMSQALSDLLSLSRITLQEIHRETVDISKLARAFERELRTSDAARDVEFIIQPEVLANGDSGLIRILVENLLRNAWKYSSKKEHARIEFGTMSIDHKPTLFVRDNGVGFDMKKADKLFQPFQRLHTDKEYKGTGIGLATVKRIVEKHGGSVWAQGEIDKGATFFFHLG